MGNEAPARRGLRHIATFCGNCNCGYPEGVRGFERGRGVEISREQLAVLVSDVKSAVVEPAVWGRRSVRRPHTGAPGCWSGQLRVARARVVAASMFRSAWPTSV